MTPTDPMFPAAEHGALAVLPRGPGRVVALNVTDGPDGRPRVSVRVWSLDRSAGRWEATSKGIEVRPHELAAFAKALVRAGQQVAERLAARRKSP